MTMDSMNKYLESRGFAVNREYVRSRQEYKFTITKDGQTKTYYWRYPRDKFNEHLTQYQEECMDKMIKSFDENKIFITSAIRYEKNWLYGSFETGYHYVKPSYADRLYPRTLSIRDYQKAAHELNEYIERRVSNMAISIPELNNRKLNIKDVIFHDPATIVLWSDGTKTVVKAVNEPFDREKGLAMAITKKFFGNKGNYYNSIKKWLKSDE